MTEKPAGAFAASAPHRASLRGRLPIGPTSVAPGGQSSGTILATRTALTGSDRPVCRRKSNQVVSADSTVPPLPRSIRRRVGALRSTGAVSRPVDDEPLAPTCALTRCISCSAVTDRLSAVFWRAAASGNTRISSKNASSLARKLLNDDSKSPIYRDGEAVLRLSGFPRRCRGARMKQPTRCRNLGIRHTRSSRSLNRINGTLGATYAVVPRDRRVRPSEETPAPITYSSATRFAASNFGLVCR